MLKKIISSIFLVSIIIYCTQNISSDVYNNKEKNKIVNAYYDYNENILNNEEFLIEISSINLYEYASINGTLEKGLEVNSFINSSTIVISGHSGLDINLPFNKLDKIARGDLIRIIKKDKIIEYIVENISYFDKNSSLNIVKNNYLYLITCDKYDLSKQLLISSKMQKKSLKLAFFGLFLHKKKEKWVSKVIY